VHVLNPNTKEIKGLIIYYKTYKIIVLKKHVDANHAIIVKKIEEVNGPIKIVFER
jgi:hypothetical protein